MSLHSVPILPSHVRVAVIHDGKNLYMDVPSHGVDDVVSEFEGAHRGMTVERILGLAAEASIDDDVYTAASAALFLFLSDPKMSPVNRHRLKGMLAAKGGVLLAVEVDPSQGKWQQRLLEMTHWPKMHNASIH